jgi:hypothetical protein
MASTGFILAAMEAGIIPETTPKIIQILKARKIIPGAMVIANGSTVLRASVSIQTKNSPTKPPIIHKNALSNKNSYKMEELLAPIAFFNPI